MSTATSITLPVESAKITPFNGGMSA